jgi:type IV pilus assembly protein PilM
MDWDPRTLRVVHASLSKRGARVEKILSAAIPPEVDTNNPEQMGGHIRTVLEQEGISTRFAVVDIPRDQAILSTLKLPCGVPDELPGMVEIQIAKELPFPVNDAAIDFVLPPEAGEEATSDVRVAAVRREVLEQYESTVAAAGLKLDRVGLRPFANKVAICDLLREDLPERVLFVDVRPALTEIDVMRSGQLAFSRAASVHIPKHLEEPRRLSIVRDEDPLLGDDDEDDETVSGADGAVKALVLEVMRSLEAYRASDPGAQMDCVIVGGDFGIERRLADTIGRRLDIPARLYNPAPSFGWGEEEGTPASAYAATVGLVLGHGADPMAHFDFLHPKKTVSQAQQKLKKAPMVAAVIALFAIAGVVAAERMTAPDRAVLADIEAQIAELEDPERVRENTRFLKVMEAVRSFEEDQRVWIDVLYDLVEALPSNKELVTTEISMRQKDDLVILKIKGKRRDTGTNVVDALNRYVPKGGSKPMFKATIHGDKKPADGEPYPFEQDLYVRLLDRPGGKRGGEEG